MMPRLVGSPKLNHRLLLEHESAGCLFTWPPNLRAGYLRDHLSVESLDFLHTRTGIGNASADCDMHILVSPSTAVFTAPLIGDQLRLSRSFENNTIGLRLAALRVCSAPSLQRLLDIFSSVFVNDIEQALVEVGDRLDIGRVDSLLVALNVNRPLLCDMAD